MDDLPIVRWKKLSRGDWAVKATQSLHVGQLVYVIRPHLPPDHALHKQKARVLRIILACPDGGTIAKVFTETFHNKKRSFPNRKEK